MNRVGAVLLLGSLLAASGCGDSSSATDGSGGGGGASSSSGAGGDAQTPPMGRANVEAWLAQGDYEGWSCEAAIHEARSPSPHGFNRICSNDLVAANATGTDAWPAGAAAVKELYASATDTSPIGYAVYLKLDADSAGGDNWYWYERVPLDSDAPHDANGVVADGDGSSGAAKQICVGCHAAAGSDAAHTPSPGGRDQVYTPVP
jgi:hypothetical protein